MDKNEYIDLFHKLQLNEVAFKPLFRCDDEVLALVNAALAQRTWVGLTDEDREKCLAKNEELGWWGVVNAIEQSLKEKNGE